jgi:HSP20 family protein
MSDKQSSDVTKAQASSPVVSSHGLDPLSTLLADMEEMMERTLGRRWPFGRSVPRILDTSAGWTPRVDVYEEGDEIVVKAELPGISKDDIEATLEAGDLVIKGERKLAQEVDEGSYYRMERAIGRFYRRVPMPEGVAAGDISATFKDGLLEVRATKPRSGEQSANKIEITQ